MFVYADNAATTALSAAAKNAMLPYLDGLCANPSSLHSAGQTAKSELERAREQVARELNTVPQNIYFTSGGSESDNQAILSAAHKGAQKGKKHIISSAFEHHAVLHTLKKLEKEGFDITLLDVHEDGLVRPQEVLDAITPETCLVSIMYVNNEIGTIQPVAEIGAICSEAGVPFHTDAVQAVGHLPIDVSAVHADMLSLSAHKFGGPKGIGALYVSARQMLSSLIEGGAQERGKRAGTENVPAIVGMAAALTDANRNMLTRNEKTARMRDNLLARLRQIPHSRVNGDLAARVSGNIHMCFEGIEGESLLLYLDHEGICASSGSACTSGSLEPSHVLLALGLPAEIAHGSLRLTINHENTPEQMEYMAQQIPRIVQHLRNMSPVWDALQKGKMKHVI